jgi:hypothetical protein
MRNYGVRPLSEVGRFCARSNSFDLQPGPLFCGVEQISRPPAVRRFLNDEGKNFIIEKDGKFSGFRSFWNSRVFEQDFNNL